MMSMIRPLPAGSRVLFAAATALVVIALSACKGASGPEDAKNEVQDRILFVSDRGGQTGDTGTALNDIYVMNVDGSEVTNLTGAPAGTYRYLGLSPKGDQVLFESDRSGCRNVWVMNTDGTEAAQLTGAPGERCNESPRWSPDGSMIAFHTSRETIDRSWEVYVMNEDGSDPHNVSDNGGVTETATDFAHGWTPTGRVVFHHQTSGPLQAYVVNADGTGLHPIFDAAGGYAPFWSPDASKVAFMSERDGNREIYVMNADGTAVQDLTNDGGADTFNRDGVYSLSDPWSPDGARLAFMSDRDGDQDVYVMNADGTGLVNLTNDPGDDRFDCWSPDGSRIIFSSDRGGTRDLYIVNADGTGLAKLTDGAGNDHGAIWVPAT
ncbi:MAG: hypothetical protein P8Z36_03230 [Gemmatimonadota bacterium]|jgi:Tol biopolymer transport system component